MAQYPICWTVKSYCRNGRSDVIVVWKDCNFNTVLLSISRQIYTVYWQICTSSLSPCTVLHLHNQPVPPSRYTHWHCVLYSSTVAMWHSYSYTLRLTFLSIAQQPQLGQGPFILKFLISHSDTVHSVWLLCKSDWPFPHIST